VACQTLALENVTITGGNVKVFEFLEIKWPTHNFESAFGIHFVGYIVFYPLFLS
jgi:hypothetical protein